MLYASCAQNFQMFPAIKCIVAIMSDLLAYLKCIVYLNSWWT